MSPIDIEHSEAASVVQELDFLLPLSVLLRLSTKMLSTPVLLSHALCISKTRRAHPIPRSPDMITEQPDVTEARGVHVNRG